MIAMTNQRSPVLGIITNNQYGVFQRNVIAGIREEAARHGCALVIDSYAEDDVHPRPISLDYRAVDGVLVIATAAPPELLQAMVAARVPVSLVSHYVPDLPIPAVITDNQQGIMALVKHVVEDCGRRSLVFIRGLAGQCDSDERERTFHYELMRYNLPFSPERSLRGDFSARMATRSLQEFLASGVPFDSIVASDYLMGIAAVDTLRAAGISVPEQVAVVAFGDGPESEQSGLTTVAADVVEQGRRATRQLLHQMQGLRIRGVTILSVRLMVRRTSLVDAPVYPA